MQLKLWFCAKLVSVSNLGHTSSRQVREGRTSPTAGMAWTSWATSRGGVQWSASGMWDALLWASGLQSGTCCDTHVYPWLRGSYRGCWRDRQALSGDPSTAVTVCWQGGQHGGQKKTVAIPCLLRCACRPHVHGFNQHTCVFFSSGVFFEKKTFNTTINNKIKNIWFDDKEVKIQVWVTRVRVKSVVGDLLCRIYEVGVCGASNPCTEFGTLCSELCKSFASIGTMRTKAILDDLNS